VVLAVMIAVVLLVIIFVCVRQRQSTTTFLTQLATGQINLHSARGQKKLLRKQAEKSRRPSQQLKARSQPLHQRLCRRLAAIGVKTRILISLFQSVRALIRKHPWWSVPGCVGDVSAVSFSLGQVLSTTSSTFDIPYPPGYRRMLRWVGAVNLPTDMLPWGCFVASMDTFLFELVLKTMVPLSIVALLVVLSRCLRRYGKRTAASKLIESRRRPRSTGFSSSF
jgi:hypothetical protein